MIILPSLEIVPAKYNTSTNTLLSQIPIDGTGDFTVSRTTSPVTGQSTRVNALGLIETVPDNVPRLDYPIGGGCPALLIEPSAQNLCPRSQEIDLWTPNVAIVTPNVAISPNGTQNAELFVPNSGSNGRTEINIGTLTNATTYTMTCFVKQHTASLDQITLYVSDGGAATGANRWGVNVSLSAFTLSNYTQSNGSVTSTSIENYGNGWYRIRVTGQVTSGMTSTSAVVIRYFGSTANGTNGVLVFGAQFELGSVPTSYIPTTTQAITRAADVITDTTASGVIGQTEGTIYCEFEFPNADKGDVIRIDSGGDANIVEFISVNSTAQRARIKGSGGSFINLVANPANMAINTRFKIAIGYKTGDFALYINGVSQSTDASAVTFNAAFNRVLLGPDVAAGRKVVRIFAAALYPTRLTDTQLALLTSPYTSYSSMASALSYTLG